MKKLFAAALLSLASLTAMAERADSLKQAVINFDSGDVDQLTQTRILTGDVVVTQKGEPVDVRTARGPGRIAPANVG